MRIGHDAITAHLRGLSRQGALSHAYLFFGPPMVGKSLFAREFAHFLEHGALGMEHEISNILLDAIFIEPDEEGAIGIDEARAIRAFLSRRPTVSRYRTVVVNNGEAMTSEAQNALLKVAEEPPPSALLIFVMRDPDQLFPTLRSRLREVYFGPVETERIAKWLREEYRCTHAEAERLAHEAMGLPGLAVRRLKDQTFQELEKSAGAFFSLRGYERSSFIKEFVQSDTFRFEDFLDALILLCAAKPPEKRDVSFWHRLLELRKNAASFNLNPRLQLEALAQTATRNM